MEMRYSDFSVTDFTLDEYFQSWVFNRGDESVDRFWKNWILDHPEKSADIAEARRILQAIEFKNHTLTEGELAQLWSRIHQMEDVIPVGRKSSPGGYLFLKYAAAIALLAVITAAYLFSGHKPWKEYRTAYGKTEEIELPDGSRVVLNANSTLTLMSEWSDDSDREISLNGEAFFSVVHTANDQLFKVNTAEGVTVEVLGTTFNVYNRTNETKVVLNSGQIRLNLPNAESGEKILMKPGEMIEYKEQRYKKKSVDPQLYSAWTNNKIILNRTSLSEMISMLKDNYGLEVKVADPVLLTQTVSGSMPLGDPEVLLKQMAMAFQLKIRREGNVIIAEDTNENP